MIRQRRLAALPAALTIAVTACGGGGGNGAGGGPISTPPPPAPTSPPPPPANPPPAFSASQSSSISIAENAQSDIQIDVSDPTGEPLTLTLGGVDAQLFEVSSAGSIRPRRAFDFEQPEDVDANNVYTLSVTASDGSTSASKAFEISVTNVREALADDGVIMVRLRYGGRTRSAAGLGDLDGDGRSEIAVAATRMLLVEKTYVIGGAALSAIESRANDIVSIDRKLAIPGSQASFEAGTHMFAGDFNGDGLSDLFINEPGYEANISPFTPRTMIVSGADMVSRLEGGSIDFLNADTTPQPDVALFGGIIEAYAVIGDLTGDGVPEVVFSNARSLAPPDSTSAGNVYVLSGVDVMDAFGIWPAPSVADTAILKIVGPRRQSARLGEATVALPGFQSAGETALILAASQPIQPNGELSSAYLFSESALKSALASGVIDLGDPTLPAGITQFQAPALKSIASISEVSDLNGDGRPEVLIGSLNTIQQSGTVTDLNNGYLIYGGTYDPFVDLTIGSSLTSIRQLQSPDVDNRMGARVTTIGDLDGDGLDEIAISDSQGGDGSPPEGVVLIIRGSALQSPGVTDLANVVAAGDGVRILGQGGRMTSAGGPIGDVSGDGLPDLLLGSDFGPGSSDPFDPDMSTDEAFFVVSGSLILNALNGSGEIRVGDIIPYEPFP